MFLRIQRLDPRNVTFRGPVATAAAVCLLAFLAAPAASGGRAADIAVPAPAPSGSKTPSLTGVLTSSATSAVAVSDSGGSVFEVSASPVVASLAITVNSFLWSAAPGQDFLVDNLIVANPTTRVESLSEFDDLTSGLSQDVAFVLRATDAAPLGYSSECGVNPAYPGPLCTISFGQGLTVDSDSADHDSRSAVMLSPGATAQIALSYGPVLANVLPRMVSVYFDGGVPTPTDLTS